MKEEPGTFISFQTVYLNVRGIRTLKDFRAALGKAVEEKHPGFKVPKAMAAAWFKVAKGNKTLELRPETLMDAANYRNRTQIPSKNQMH
ncbi:MAG: hypothetical protein AAF244_01215 [Pseudomonadota bacterium]